jgi:hypothetical protein
MAGQSEEDASKQKIDAIFELRKAAEQKGRREKELVENPTPQQRDRLLDSMLTLEAKTAKAIAACHECGHAHEPGGAHGPGLN